MADFHAGITQNALALKYSVSPSTINNLCKGVTPKNIDKVNTLTRMKIELAAQTECEANAIRQEVDLRTKDMEFFRSASLKIARKAIEKVAMEDLNMVDIERAQNVIGKGRENIYGRTPDTAVQINNNNAAPESAPLRPQVDRDEWLKLHGIS